MSDSSSSRTMIVVLAAVAAIGVGASLGWNKLFGQSEQEKLVADLKAAPMEERIERMVKMRSEDVSDEERQKHR